MRLPYVTYEAFLAATLGIMDIAAVAMARDNRKRIRVFDIFEPGSLARVLNDAGTYSDIGPVSADAFPDMVPVPPR
jgi:uridylate kinase